MGATFAGIIRTPMTSVFMIFELTRNYSILVPLMIANMTSYILAARLQKKSIYIALAEQDGIHLQHHGASKDPRGRTVLLAMNGDPTIVDPQTALQDLPVAPGGDLYLVVENGKLIGVVSLDSVRKALGDGQRPVLVGELAGAFAHVHPDHSLELAMQRMGQAGWAAVPVVDRADSSKLRGLITVEDVLRVYGRGGE